MTQSSTRKHASEPGSNGDEGVVERAETAARRAMLAGIGALATACDMAEDTFDRLVTRGENVRKDWEERTDEVRRENVDRRRHAREYVRTVMDTVFEGLNVPSKSDVDALNLKLNVLTRKIDDLQMQAARSEEPAAKPPPAPPADPAV